MKCVQACGKQRQGLAGTRKTDAVSINRNDNFLAVTEIFHVGFPAFLVSLAEYPIRITFFT